MKPRLNRSQAEAAIKIFVYSELLVTALDDFHHQNEAIRRTLLKNRINQLRSELADMLRRLYAAQGGISAEAEMQFYQSIDIIEKAHLQLYAARLDALPKAIALLEIFNKEVRNDY
ncbi:hypothetical protein [Rhodoflexus sp.]